MTTQSILNPFSWTFRTQYFAGFFVCVALLVYAIYYVDITLGIEPCPLCIFQRIAFMFMAVLFLIGVLHNPAQPGRRVYALLVLLGAAAGAGIAIYHLWVQQLPPDPLAGCSPGFTYMVENLPINVWIKKIFTGHADCAINSWPVFGLPMPFWTLVCYVLLGSGAVWAGFRKR